MEKTSIRKQIESEYIVHPASNYYTIFKREGGHGSVGHYDDVKDSVEILLFGNSVAQNNDAMDFRDFLKERGIPYSFDPTNKRVVIENLRKESERISKLLGRLEEGE